HEVAVAVGVDRGEMLDERVGTLAAGIGARFDFGAAEAAIAIGVESRVIVVGAVLRALAPMVAMPALRALAGLEASVAIAVEAIEMLGQAREFRRFGTIDRAVPVGIERCPGAALGGCRWLGGSGDAGSQRGQGERGKQDAVLHLRIPRRCGS